jgi:nonribosomal peptide synthetase DhbF
VLCGATVIIARKETVDSPGDLATLLTRSEVNVMQATPTLWQLLVERHPEAVSGMHALVGGEALPPDLATRLYRSAQEVTNLYGPTETTVWSTFARLSGSHEKPPPIGVPVRNTDVYLLNDQLTAVSAGDIGEIYIAGLGVARGYLNRPCLTASRFVADPWGPPGRRMYRTGDLGRWGADGNLEFHGRVDHQVKLRGHRIELGEIEAVLGTHPGVVRVVVTARPHKGDPILVAYVAKREATAESDLAQQLRRLAEQHLPAPMVPSFYIVMAELPMTSNGKVDRAALPDHNADAGTGEGRRPSTDHERLLCDLHGQVLGVGPVSIDDNFVDLGGTSISAHRLIDQIRRTAGVELSIGELFEFASIEMMAAKLHILPSARPSLIRPSSPLRIGDVP